MRQLGSYDRPVRHIGVQPRHRREGDDTREVVVVGVVGGIRQAIWAEPEAVGRGDVRMRSRIRGRIVLRDLRLESSRRARLARKRERAREQHDRNAGYRRWDELVSPHRMPLSPSRLPLGSFSAPSIAQILTDYRETSKGRETDRYSRTHRY